jgi:hypothetical protein
MPPRGRHQARRRQQTLARRHQRKARLARQRWEAATLIAAERERVRAGIRRRSLRQVAKTYGLQLSLYGDSSFFHLTFYGGNAICIYANNATAGQIVDLPTP